jgi:hypothetical protein
MQTNVRSFCHHRAMNNSEQVSIAITLSPTQVDEVVRAASQSRVPSISTLIAASLNAPLDVADRADEESQVGGYLPIGAFPARYCGGSRCSPASALTAVRGESSNSPTTPA